MQENYKQGCIPDIRSHIAKIRLLGFICLVGLRFPDWGLFFIGLRTLYPSQQTNFVVSIFLPQNFAAQQ